MGGWAVGRLGFKHQAVSHLTGTSSLLGVAIANGNGDDIIHLSLILISFLVGAALSGIIVRDITLRLGPRYGVALFIEAAFLFLAMLMLNHGSTMGHFFASAACGLQNAMVSTYSGPIVRTPHVSGMFTDPGVMLGGYLRGVRGDAHKLMLYLLLILGFILGGVIGTAGFSTWRFSALAIPAGIALLLSLTYWLYWYRLRAQAGQNP